MTSDGVAQITACVVIGAAGPNPEAGSSDSAPSWRLLEAMSPVQGVLAESTPYGTVPFCVPDKVKPSSQEPLQTLGYGPFLHPESPSTSSLAHPPAHLPLASTPGHLGPPG